MRAALFNFALIAGVAFAQERCDAPYPNVYCNTTEILAFESYDCAPYHIFIARGSDEPYPGRQGNITREICSRIGSDECSFENIEYPARSTAWGKEEWCKSATKGQTNGQAQMKGYAEKCPNSKLILLGFSQGAAVAQDILGGGGGKVFECEQPTSRALDTATGSKVVAAVTFGAVIRSRNQNFTIGKGVDFDGQRARTPSQLQALNKYSDRLRDYCHYGDPMCAVGSDPVNVYNHLNYFLEHNEEVVSWVVEKAKSGSQTVSEGKSPSPSPSPLPSTSRQASSPAQSSTPRSSPQFIPSATSRSSIIPTQTNTLLQSSSTTSVPAKSAAASPSIIASATRTAADSSETTSTQSGTTGNAATGNGSTGAANALVFSPVLAIAVAALVFAM